MEGFHAMDLPHPSKDHRARYAGIQNLGYTGYLDVILQNLYHQPCFRYFVLNLNLSSSSSSDNSSSDHKRNMMVQLQKMFCHLETANNVPTIFEAQNIQNPAMRIALPYIRTRYLDCFDPTNFVNAAKDTIKLINDLYLPNDTKDFAEELLHGIHMFLKKSLAVSASTLETFQRMFQHAIVTNAKCKLCSECLQQTFKVHVGATWPYCQSFAAREIIPTLTVEGFTCLSDSFRDTIKRLQKHAVDCFMHRIPKRCPACQTTSNQLWALQQYVDRHPQILVLKLRRNKKGGRYLTQRFELDEILTHPMGTKDHPHLLTQYKLVGVVIFQGSEQGGRYFTYIRDHDRPSSSLSTKKRSSLCWLKFWGSNVHYVDYRQVVADAFGGQTQEDVISFPYVVFYEKIPTSPSAVATSSVEEVKSNNGNPSEVGDRSPSSVDLLIKTWENFSC